MEKSADNGNFYLGCQSAWSDKVAFPSRKFSGNYQAVNAESGACAGICVCNRHRTHNQEEGNRETELHPYPELPDNANKTSLGTAGEIPTGLVCR